MVEPPAARSVFDFLVERLKVIFDDPVKVDECLVGVVERLHANGFFGEEDGSASCEWLRIDGVL